MIVEKKVINRKKWRIATVIRMEGKRNYYYVGIRFFNCCYNGCSNT